MKPKFIRIMSLMNKGVEFEIGGYTHTIIDNQVCYKVQTWSDIRRCGIDEPEVKWFVANFVDINKFIRDCEEISDDDIFIAAANKTLTEINRNDCRD